MDVRTGVHMSALILQINYSDILCYNKPTVLEAEAPVMNPNYVCVTSQKKPKGFVLTPVQLKLTKPYGHTIHKMCVHH